jgi:hypothetical protein
MIGVHSITVLRMPPRMWYSVCMHRVHLTVDSRMCSAIHYMILDSASRMFFQRLFIVFHGIVILQFFVSQTSAILKHILPA